MKQKLEQETKKDVQKFLIRSFVFILLISLPFLPEISSEFASHNYRSWEALSTHLINVDRPFYVDRYLEKTEFGDLGYNNAYGIEKRVVWITDAYGYRNRVTQDPSHIVVIGDSNIVGSSLTQRDMFSETLQRQISCPVYGLAPASINTFISDERFVSHPPKIVIFESIERNLHGIAPIDVHNTKTSMHSRLPLFLQKVEDQLDYYLKLSFWRSTYADLLEYIHPPIPIVNQDTHMLFMKRAFDAQAENLNASTYIFDTIVAYDAYFRSQNITFVFMPIPDKESIYADDIPTEFHKNYTNFLPTLIDDLQAHNVTVVNMYDDFYQAHNYTYHLDDTHWNAYGVQIAVNQTLKTIGTKRIDYLVCD